VCVSVYACIYIYVNVCVIMCNVCVRTCTCTWMYV